MVVYQRRDGQVRHRVAGKDVPPDLLSFGGWPEHQDAQLWEQDFEAWHRRRDAWLAERGLTADQVPGFEFPRVGSCPFDPETI